MFFFWSFEIFWLCIPHVDFNVIAGWAFHRESYQHWIRNQAFRANFVMSWADFMGKINKFRTFSVKQWQHSNILVGIWKCAFSSAIFCISRIVWQFSMKLKKLNRKLVSNGYEKCRFSKIHCEKIRFRWNKERKMAFWTHQQQKNTLFHERKFISPFHRTKYLTLKRVKMFIFLNKSCLLKKKIAKI